MNQIAHLAIIVLATLTLSAKPMQMHPCHKINNWIQEAVDVGVSPHHMSIVLGTASKEGVPSTRVINILNVDESGCLFFTHANRQKVKELESNPQAALTFWFKETGKQICLQGEVVHAPKSLRADYWSRFPKKMQLAYLASDHESEMLSDAELHETIAQIEAHYSPKNMDVIRTLNTDTKQLFQGDSRCQAVAKRDGHQTDGADQEKSANCRRDCGRHCNAPLLDGLIQF